MKPLTMLNSFGCALAANVIFTAPPVMAQEKKPNVVFILADNVGYGDMGPYGGGELRGAPTPNVNRLAREGLRLTHFMVEAACTPSRAALLTGQYPIRNGLSLVILPGTPNTLPGKAFTMGKLFKKAGYATAIYGKWHLGNAPESLPTAHGFDEFYGLPPNLTWNCATYASTTALTHSSNKSLSELRKDGPYICEAVANGPLRKVKPYTMEVRREIDFELTKKSIDFMKRQTKANKPFFLYLPFSMGHFPNLASKQFAGKSRIGQYGDRMMEGDYHVGQILQALKDLKIDKNTIFVFASDNGPEGQVIRDLGNQGTPDMGNSGPFRGELGEATEGAIRTFCFIRWPGKVKPDTTSNAMFSIMDFLPTFANIIGAKLPDDRPIDGVDQTNVLFGKSKEGARESLLTFIGADLVAVRWKQWCAYMVDIHPTGIGSQRMPGIFSAFAPLSYPTLYNIEMDPHENIQVAGQFAWVLTPVNKVIAKYQETLKKYPNPPAPNLTKIPAPMLKKF
jgi:arylsulfatase